MNVRESFRFVEKCLYNYPANLARIEVLKEDLRVLRAYGDTRSPSIQLTFNFSNTYSDPVVAHVEKVQRLEAQIQRLERITKPITKLMEDVKRMKGTNHLEQKEILEQFYFSGVPLSEVADSLHRSKRTLSRRRKFLVYKIMEYLGL